MPCRLAGVEEAVGSTVKGEQSIIVCPTELLEQGENSLVPKVTTRADRVELEIELLSYTQVSRVPSCLCVQCWGT